MNSFTVCQSNKSLLYFNYKTESMSNILNPLFDHTDSFRPWASYLHSIIMKNKNPKIEVVLSGYKKDIIDDERIIRNNIIAARNLDPKTMDSKFSSMLVDIQDIFTWIESYNSDFRIERVESSFEYLNIKWNDSQFELIKKLSVAVVPIMEETFKRLIKYSINHSVFNSDPKFRIDLFKKIKSPYILAILKQSNGETIFEEKESDSIAPKTNINQNYSFIIDYRIPKDMDKESKKDRKSVINEAFLKLLVNLKVNEFFSDEATPAKLQALYDSLNVKNKIRWTGSVGSLHYFVKCITPYLNDNYSCWESAANCFLNKEGRPFDVDSLRSDFKAKDYKSSQSKIDSVTKSFIDKIKSFPKN